MNDTIDPNINKYNNEYIVLEEMERSGQQMALYEFNY